MSSEDLEKGTKNSDFRTSKQAWLHNDLSPLIEELDERVASLTRVPAEHNEEVQLLRYDQGTYYHAHTDWAELDFHSDQRETWEYTHMGYQDRLATVFWYLNDVEVGGETIFPKEGQRICDVLGKGGIGSRTCHGAHDPEMDSCDKGLKVKPRRGSVILWYNYHANARGDRNSLHAGCPVGEGLVKWSANKWVRIKPVHTENIWVEDHPALKRFGWVGDKADRSPAESNAAECVIWFTNEASESVNVLWMNEDEEAEDIQQLEAGAETSLDSSPGHRFQLGSIYESGRKSNVVECEAPESKFTLSGQFILTDDAKAKPRRKGELRSKLADLVKSFPTSALEEYKDEF